AERHARAPVGTAGRSRAAGALSALSPAIGAAMAFYGLRRGSWTGAALMLTGGTLIYRGLRGNGRQPIEVTRSVTINRPAEELYRFWRNLENLPHFMSHLEAVTVLDDRRSHWVARAPVKRTIEWDAAITADEENRMIAWRSLEGSAIANEGMVRFDEEPAGRGTKVTVFLRYDPPGGAIGAAFARLFGEAPEQQIAEDLRRFKQIMETGEIATTEGQPAGARPEQRRIEDRARLLIQVAEATGIASPGG